MLLDELKSSYSIDTILVRAHVRTSISESIRDVLLDSNRGDLGSLSPPPP
jgi:hypothetical protein